MFSICKAVYVSYSLIYFSSDFLLFAGKCFVKAFKENVASILLFFSLQEYESGEIRSAACITEMKREKDAHENTKLVLEKKVCFSKLKDSLS